MLTCFLLLKKEKCTRFYLASLKYACFKKQYCVYTLQSKHQLSKISKIMIQYCQHIVETGKA